jgi:hypothetical protein
MTRYEEHLDVASQLGGAIFTSKDFDRVYGLKYPHRKPRSRMPIEYVGLRADGTLRNVRSMTARPKFLTQHGRGHYQYTPSR